MIDYATKLKFFRRKKSLEKLVRQDRPEVRGLIGSCKDKIFPFDKAYPLFIFLDFFGMTRYWQILHTTHLLTN